MEERTDNTLSWNEEPPETPKINSLQWQAGIGLWLYWENKAIPSHVFYNLAAAFGALDRNRLTAPGEAFKETMRKLHDECLAESKEIGGCITAGCLITAIIWGVKAARDAKAANPDYERDRIDMCVDPEFK